MALPATEAFTGTAGNLTTGYTQMGGVSVARDGSGHGQGSGGGDAICYDNVNTYNNDQYSQQVVFSTSGGSPEPVVRASGTGSLTGYFTYFSGGVIGLGKFVSGAFTDKGSVAGSWTAGDLCRIEVSGTGITVKKNGTTVTTATDSSLASGAAGPGLDSSTAILIDDWEGGNLSGGGGTTVFAGAYYTMMTHWFEAA